MKNQKTQLFLLHFAGGSSYSFSFLKPYLEDTLEFIPLELPGRGKRLNERLLKSKPDAILDYVLQIKKIRNRSLPYIIYGHSMGATLGVSITKEMQNLKDPPLQLIVSGNPGPGITEDEKKENRYLLNDDDFKEELRRLGGVPQEVLENEELYDFFAPIMRADFEALENDDFSEKGILLDVPINAIMGSEEQTSSQIENWKNFTTQKCNYQILDGNHFFIYDHPHFIAKEIKKCYTKEYADL